MREKKKFDQVSPWFYNVSSCALLKPVACGALLLACFASILTDREPPLFYI